MVKNILIYIVLFGMHFLRNIFSSKQVSVKEIVVFLIFAITYKIIHNIKTKFWLNTVKIPSGR